MAARKHLVSLPVYVGIFLLLLTLPTLIISVQSEQDIRKYASTREFTIPRGAEYVPDELIIKYKPTLEIKTNTSINQHKESFEVDDIEKGLPSYSLTNLQAAGARKVERAFKDVKLPQERGMIAKLLGVVGMGAKPNEMANYLVIKVPSTTNLQQAIDILIKDPNIEAVEPNYKVKLYGIDYGNDSYYSQQWSLPKISMPQAWSSITPEHEVIVAVMDTGVDSTHPDLQGKLVTGKNMLDGSTNTNDTFGHGTHIAGTIAATINNTTGIAGLASKVKIMPIKVQEGQAANTPLTLISNAMLYAADNGANVLNISLGFTIVNGSSQILDDTVNYVANKGVTMVAAAGNENIDMANELPSSYSQVIAVSATTQQDTKASFSNYGNKIAVAAPGVGILSAAPQNAIMSYDGGCVDSARRYCMASGTSMAAPHVTGLVALMLSVDNTITPTQIRELLTAFADDIGPAGKDIQFGYGRINAARVMEHITNENGTSSPTPTSSGMQNELQALTSQLKASCGGQAAISKKISELSGTGRHWASWTADYNGEYFSATGDVYIYVKSDCQASISGQEVTLQAGTNKVTLPGTTVNTQPTSTKVKKRNILNLLMGN